MRFFPTMIFAAALLSGCATGVMSEKECLAGDWRAAGLEDGAKGLLETAFDARAARCAEFGAGADAAAYKAGRRAALSRLCTDQGGYEYARAGGVYLGVCRPQAEPDFLAGYLSGRRIHAAQTARDDAQSAYDDAVSKIEYHRDQIRRAQDRLDDPDATEKEIKKAHEDLVYHRGRIPYAKRTADRKLYALGRADEALDATIATTADWRRGDAFMTARDILLEAHAFARSAPEIDHCTDDLPAYTPRCFVRPGAALADSRSGAVCAVGPGEGLYARRGPWYADGQIAGFAQFFDFFPESGRAGSARRSRTGFEVFFNESGAYSGLACAAGPLVN